MSTLININVDLAGILARLKAQQDASRFSQTQKEVDREFAKEVRRILERDRARQQAQQQAAAINSARDLKLRREELSAFRRPDDQLGNLAVFYRVRDQGTNEYFFYCEDGSDRIKENKSSSLIPYEVTQEAASVWISAFLDWAEALNASLTNDGADPPPGLPPGAGNDEYAAPFNTVGPSLAFANRSTVLPLGGTEAYYGDLTKIKRFRAQGGIFYFYGDVLAYTAPDFTGLPGDRLVFYGQAYTANESVAAPEEVIGNTFYSNRSSITSTGLGVPADDLELIESLSVVALQDYVDSLNIGADPSPDDGGGIYYFLLPQAGNPSFSRTEYSYKSPPNVNIGFSTSYNFSSATGPITQAITPMYYAELLRSPSLAQQIAARVPYHATERATGGLSDPTEIDFRAVDDPFGPVLFTLPGKPYVLPPNIAGLTGVTRYVAWDYGEPAYCRQLAQSVGLTP